MNQVKIGKFIAECRKKNNLTQMQLAEKLNITDRAISKWENGKNLPDMSLLKPLCNILDITINELLSGEYINEEKNEEKLEENIVNAINYNKRRQNINELIFQLFIIIFGMLMFIISMSIFNTPSSSCLWYSVLGTFVLIIIFSYLLKKIITSNKSRKYVILSVLGFFILYFAYSWLIDFINVKKHNAEPNIFVVSASVTDNTFSYDTFFYDLHICNNNQPNEYRKLVFNLNHAVDFEKINKYCNK